jgi:alkylation response protein AidB-like acyl-CoA dehydrogenase
MNLDFRLSEGELILRDTALNFLKRDLDKRTLEELHDSDTGITEGLWRKMVEMGWPGILVPEAYGGSGLPLTTAGVLFEALGSGPLSGPLFATAVLGALIIGKAASADQRKELLPLLVQGKLIPALVLTDEELGWNSRAARLQVQEREGTVFLSGQKLLVYEAEAATHLIVPTPFGGKKEALTLFLVDKHSPGLEIRRLPGYLMGRAFEVTLHQVPCPPTARLGRVGRGRRAFAKAIRQALPILCAYLVGGCQAVCDLTLAYSRVRVQFAQPIGRFQRVQDMIIEMINQADAARWTTYEALWRLDTRGDDPKAVHLAKAVAAEAYWQCCTLAHRVISGISYSREHPLSLHTRTSRALYTFLGDPAFHKQRLAGLLLGKGKRVGKGSAV